jgi:hypothetical protein
MTIVETWIWFDTVCFEQRGTGAKPTMDFGFESLDTSKQLKILGGMQNFFRKGTGFPRPVMQPIKAGAGDDGFGPSERSQCPINPHGLR